MRGTGHPKEEETQKVGKQIGDQTEKQFSQAKPKDESRHDELGGAKGAEVRGGKGIKPGWETTLADSETVEKTALLGVIQADHKEGKSHSAKTSWAVI